MAWAFEDKFNSDTKSTGDLNGQDGWTGTASDAIVGAVSVYDGDQSVYCTDEVNITHTFTGVASGVVYVAMKMTSSSGDRSFHIRCNSNTEIKWRILGQSGNVTMTNGAGATTIITGYSTTIFYLFEVTINADDTCDIRYHNGTSWSTPVTGLAANTGASEDVDAVTFNGGTPLATYYDTITPTNPIASSNIKSLDTNVYANIKSYNTNLIANIKSIDTNV